MRRSLLALVAILFLVLPPAPLSASESASEAGHAVYLKDGTRIECVETPLIALGRVLYRTANGVRHALPVDKVDLEKTRPATRQVVASPAARPAPQATPAAAAAPTSRRAAPDFEALRADGTKVKLSELGGKVVLVDFWASWCGPCVMDMPHVKKVYEKHAGKDFEIVGVSLDRRQSDLDAFVKAQGLKWPQSFDGRGWDNAVARQYGVRAIPSMFLVDRSGRIARAGVRSQTLDAEVAALLAEPVAEPAAPVSAKPGQPPAAGPATAKPGKPKAG